MIRKRLQIFLVLFVFVNIQWLQAQQEVRVTGKVTNAKDGSPVPGVSVLVKETTKGTITDAEGAYSIHVSGKGKTLVFQHIGMQTAEVAIEGRHHINVQLKYEQVGLDDIIVTAYGTKTRQSKTGALSVIESADIQDAPVSSFEKALQGRVAGVQINNSSGAPGAKSDIVIRGISSINANTDPLWVIDGVPLVGEQDEDSYPYSFATNVNNVLATINPDDIKSISILKDAAASSLYGSRAANGVILVTTKKGTAGKTKFHLRAETGLSTLSEDSRNFRFMDAKEAWSYWRTAAENAGYDPDDPASGQYYLPRSLIGGELTNWWDEVMQNGLGQEYELSANGGKEKTQFHISGAYTNKEGIQINSSMERYTGRVNFNHTVSDRLNLGIRANGASIKLTDRFESLTYGNPLYAAANLFPWENVKNDDGTYNWDLPTNMDSNPVAMGELNEYWDEQQKLTATAFLEFDITKGLSFKTTNTYDFYLSQGRDYNHPSTPTGKESNGFDEEGFIRNITLTTSNTLNYNKSIADDHHIDLLAGFETQENEYKYWRMKGEGMGEDIPYLSNVSQGHDVGFKYQEWALISYLGKLDYDYADKYFLTVSVRTDGSSRFGKDKRWAFFPAVGASWNIHQESFMEGIDMINILKIRGSYGHNGNWEIGNYESYGLYNTRTYNGASGLAPGQMANPNLSWELNKSFNIGADFNLWGRINGTLEYYQRITEEMLLEVPLSQTTGFTTLRKNIGSMKNDGLELNINTLVIDSDIDWEVGFNVTTNHVEIIDLAGQEEVARDETFWRRIRVGEHFEEYYVYDWAGVNPVNGLGLWYDEDGNITQDYNKARRVMKGNTLPDYYGGFNTKVSYKGLSLNTAFEYKTGLYVYVMENRYTSSDGYSFQNQVADATDYWKKPGDITPVPKPIAGNTTNSNAWASSRFLEKGDYLRFKQLSLSYQLSQKLVRQANLQNITVYTSILNLYTWHDVSYWGPERDLTGGGYATYPNPTTYSLGVNLTF